jgi:hypothetical protein
MRSIGLLLLFQIICGGAVFGSQESIAPSPLVLLLQPSSQPGKVHIALRNVSNKPVHVLLGHGDGSGHDYLMSFSLQLTSPSGDVFQFVTMDGGFLAGSLRIVNEIIPPQKEWSVELPLSGFIGDLQGKPLISPKTVDMLPRGVYQIRALFRGTNSDWPEHTLSYWVGDLRSNSISYQLP